MRRITYACRSLPLILLALLLTLPVLAVFAAWLPWGGADTQAGPILREMAWPPGHAPLRWHCIGPIQSNKTRLVAEHFDWAQSVDRLKIAQRLSDQRPEGLAPLQVCLQVNPDGGAAKSGVPPEEALALAQEIALLPNLQLRGLMAIPEEGADFAAQYAVHRRVRQLFDSIAASGAPGLAAFDTLSLGMTADLEAAVHAGSTMVRVGRGIFGKR